VLQIEVASSACPDIENTHTTPDSKTTHIHNYETSKHHKFKTIKSSKGRTDKNRAIVGHTNSKSSLQIPVRLSAILERLETQAASRHGDKQCKHTRNTYTRFVVSHHKRQAATQLLFHTMHELPTHLVDERTRENGQHDATQTAACYNTPITLSSQN
jgi:hypothetical protein